MFLLCIFVVTKLIEVEKKNLTAIFIICEDLKKFTFLKPAIIAFLATWKQRNKL